jgi:DNA polymerase-1
LAAKLDPEIEAENMGHLYHDVELPLAKVLAKMELTGIICNPDKLKTISAEMEELLEQLTAEIYEIAGREFNINSPKQLGVVLFDELGLPVLKKTKTGPSTNAEVLEQLSYHPIVDKVLTYRQLSKLKSTYTDALVELINPETNRIHTTFNQTITATGRLSSANPNLQNIPIRTAEGRRIRGAFEPQEGWHLLSADYSQIELRVLAHISGDAGLIDAFKSGADIHRRTASEILEIPMEEVSAADRDSAKAINFGIIYGISSYGLAKGTKLTQAQAQQYIDQYFARYPQVKAYLDNTIKTAKTEGYVTTILNRRRYLPDINSRNYQRRSFAERMAMNTPIQGSAADIIKMAMLKVDQALAEQNFKTRMLLQVHDELVFEVPPEELETAAALVKQTMESVIELKVPLRVDVKVGRDWEQVKAFEVK